MSLKPRLPQPEEIAHRLRAAAAGDSASAVARRTGASRETTRRYLASGQPSVGFLAEFCLAYDVNPGWIIFGRSPRTLDHTRRVGPSAYATAELVDELHRRIGDDTNDLDLARQTPARPPALAGNSPRRFPPLQAPGA